METAMVDKSIIQYVIMVLLCASGFEVYLKVNKVWKRKHEKAVVESISFTGFSLSLLGYLTYVIYYIFYQNDLLSTICTLLYWTEAGVFLLISTGLFLKDKKKVGIFKLIRQTLRLERKEANYLLKVIFTKNHAESVVKILHQLAFIDNHLDEKERKIIEDFITTWEIDYSLDQNLLPMDLSEKEKYQMLNETMVNFLKSDPQKQQVKEMKEIMNDLIMADNVVTDSESIMIDELNGIIDQFLESKVQEKYNVIIIPQDANHYGTIEKLLPKAEKVNVAGGVVYKAGEYFSYKYAQMISNSFRESNLFSVVSQPRLDLIELKVANPQS